MDTQGSEMPVLKGAEPMLNRFKFVKTEVADFESYAGRCQLTDLERFMNGHGFREFSRHAFARHPNGGACYDVIYKRKANN
jgi:hypothetical protein